MTRLTQAVNSLLAGTSLRAVSDRIANLMGKGSAESAQADGAAPKTEKMADVGRTRCYRWHEDLLKGIYAMKYQKPSKIQDRALPLLLQNPPCNMIGQSQSGTGQTAAFVLDVLSRIGCSIKSS
ncbi:hypothetical protein A4X09_0g1478 [Tilletia walkeri]|uniref:RNA helicase n=1 Tax=Tilletia walkeri TaxID=117179 RepID=A0A8X7T708_9BASI|nr:hypothetical protein A4X09_0g1478 [Tilletia walkeri]